MQSEAPLRALTFGCRIGPTSRDKADGVGAADAAAAGAAGCASVIVRSVDEKAGIERVSSPRSAPQHSAARRSSASISEGSVSSSLTAAHAITERSAVLAASRALRRCMARSALLRRFPPVAAQRAFSLPQAPRCDRPVACRVLRDSRRRDGERAARLRTRGAVAMPEPVPESRRTERACGQSDRSTSARVETAHGNTHRTASARLPALCSARASPRRLAPRPAPCSLRTRLEHRLLSLHPIRGCSARRG